jgi:hypothetical protein
MHYAVSAGGAAFFTAAFFLAGVVFFVIVADLAAARFRAHIFFVAAMIAALPAALSFLFGFGAFAGAGAGGSASPLTLAHLAFWAKAILRRAAAENFFRFLAGASDVAAISVEPGSIARSSLIWESIWRFCLSKP